jgi:hypothetical protein
MIAMLLLEMNYELLPAARNRRIEIRSGNKKARVGGLVKFGAAGTGAAPYILRIQPGARFELQRRVVKM